MQARREGGEGEGEVRQSNYETQLPTMGAPYIYTAIRIADKYRHRTPTVADLIADFGMHRATAYRWLRAIKDARGLA